MKKIFMTIMAAAFVFSGCNSVLIENVGRGQLSVELSAADEYVVVSKAVANENVNEFRVEIADKSSGAVVNAYNRFADMPQIIELLSGTYTISVSSPAQLAAAFNQPIYGASQDFTVKVGEVTSEKLVCTLQNVKVSFSLSEAFKRELSSYTISVSNGEGATNALYWTNVSTETEDQYTTKNIDNPGYFTVAPLTVRVDGKRSVDGSDAYHEIRINDAKAKDHFIISLDAKVTGSAGFGIEIDPSVNLRDDEEVFVPGFDEDPVVEPEEDETPDDNTGSGDNTGNEGGSGDNSGDQGGSGDTPANDMVMTWAGHESVDNVYPSTPIDANLGEVNLLIDVPGKIAGFVVQIESESEAFMGAVYEMTTDGGNRLDLINDAKAIQAMKDVELLTGDLKGLTQVPFNLTGLLPLIPVVAEPGTSHFFTLTVTDETGYSETWKLTFSLPNA